MDKSPPKGMREQVPGPTGRSEARFCPQFPVAEGRASDRCGRGKSGVKRALETAQPLLCWFFFVLLGFVFFFGDFKTFNTLFHFVEVIFMGCQAVGGSYGCSRSARQSSAAGAGDGRTARPRELGLERPSLARL